MKCTLVAAAGAALAFVLALPGFSAVEPDSLAKLKSPEAKRALLNYEEAVAKARKELEGKIAAARRALLVELELAQETAAKANRLDDAVTLRDGRAAIDAGRWDAAKSDDPLRLLKQEEVKRALKTFDGAATQAGRDLEVKQAAARKELLAELNVAQEKATRDNQLEEAVAIRAARARLEQESGSLLKQPVFLFDGKSRIVTSLERFAPATLEAWIRPDTVPAPTVPDTDPKTRFIIGSDVAGKFGYGLGIRYRTQDQVGGLQLETVPAFLDSTAVPRAGVWSHVAAVLGPRQSAIYLNGRRVAQLKRKLEISGGAPFVIGHIGLGNPAPLYFNGAIREVRISRAERYEGDFTPTTSFEKDASTALIYRAANTEGKVALDLSGNGKNGEMDGVVVADVPTGVKPAAAAMGEWVVLGGSRPLPGFMEASAAAFNVKDGLKIRADQQIRSKDAALLSKDFVFDVIYHLDDGRNILLIGVGEGVRGGPGDHMVNSAYLRIHARDHGEGLVDLCGGKQAGQGLGNVRQKGPHLCRVEKKGDVVTFSICINYNGEFNADLSHSITDLREFVSELNNKNTHVFIGATGPGCLFKQIRLNVTK